MTQVAVVILEVPEGTTVEDAIWQLRRSVALTEIAPTVTEERVTEAPMTEAPMSGKPMTEVLTSNATVEMETATEVPPGPTTPPPVVETPTPPVLEPLVRRNGRGGKKDAKTDKA